MAKEVLKSRFTVVDQTTGEIIKEESTKTVNYGQEPNYIKLYLKDIMYLSDMPQKYVKVTEALLKRVSFASEEDGMCVSLTSYVKDKIVKELGWKSRQVLDNSISELCKGKILYRVARGTYRFNPYLFGRGDWADISSLRLEINYDDINGRTFGANVKYKEEPDGQMTMTFEEASNG